MVLKRFVPMLPGTLVVALGSIALVWLLDLEGHGLEVVGHIDSGLPHLGVPDVTRDNWRDLAGACVGVMLVGFAEGLGAAKTYAAREGYDIDANRELMGLGAANLGAGLSSGMVVNGSLSKTAVNGSAGARSELSALTAASLTILTLLFLTGLFEKLPQATLAAIVISAVVELVDVESLRRLWRVRSGRLARLYRLTSRADFVAAVAALLGVLVFDTLPGLVLGIVISLVLLIARTSRPRVAVLVQVETHGRPVWVDSARHPGTALPTDVLVVRVEAPLFFGNADYVRDQVRGHVSNLAGSEHAVPLVVLDGRATPSVDVTAASMLVQLQTDLRRFGTDLALAGDVGQVRDVLAQAAAGGEPPLYADIDEAIADHSRETGEDADPDPPEAESDPAGRSPDDR